MDSMNLKIKLTENQQELRNRQLANVLQHPETIRFMRKYKLNKEFVDDNLQLFDKWLDRQDKCIRCKGLPFCVQPIKGKLENLIVDDYGYLESVYTSCRYKREEEKLLAHARNFLIKNGGKEELLIELGELDLSYETNQYINCYVQLMKSIDSDKGIYFYGQPGVGKTFLLNGIANRLAKKDNTVAFINMNEFVQNLKEEMTNYEYRQQMLGYLKRADVAFLDDIGSEFLSKWTRDEILSPILEYRMHHNKKTYFSSNFSLEELEHVYDLGNEPNSQVKAKRIIDRIHALSEPLILVGSSRR